MVEQASLQDICPDLADLVVYLLLAQTGFPNHSLIKDNRAIVGNGTKAALGAEGQGDFAGNDKVKVGTQRQGDTKRYRHASVGDAQYYHGLVRIVSKFFSKLTSAYYSARLPD